jgi:hypothetical protein
MVVLAAGDLLQSAVALAVSRSAPESTMTW